MRPPALQRHLFRGGVWEGGAPGAGVGEAWLALRIEPAVITTNPVSQFGAPFGSTVTFSVAATGTAPLRYQWRLNGLTLPGQTNTTLTITTAQMINGGAYSVTLDSFFNTVESSPASLTFPLPTLPLRNNFADLVVLSDPFANGYSSNEGANKDPGEPKHAGRPGGKSMWLGWQAPASGIVTFAITGSGFDTLLAAYRLVSGSLVEVVSDEESGGFLTSRIQFNAIAGETCYIAGDGFGGEEGPIALNWSLQPTSQVLPVVVAPPQSIVAGARGDRHLPGHGPRESPEVSLVFQQPTHPLRATFDREQNAFAGGGRSLGSYPGECATAITTARRDWSQRKIPHKPELFMGWSGF
jgi:hypothetical protein